MHSRFIFDFGGYSDMAIGLGKMFGFEFLVELPLPVCIYECDRILEKMAYISEYLVP